jgi:replicative DNA helicase
VQSSTKALLDLRESGAIIETDADVVTLIERTYTTSPVTWQTTI